MVLVSEAIERADRWVESSLPLDEKIDVIRNVELDFYSNLKFLKFETATIDLVAEQDTYSLASEDFDFDSIQKLVIDGIEYKKMTVEENYTYTYYEDGDNIVIDPEPVTSETAGIEITYLYQPSEKTVDNTDTATLDIVEDFGNRWKDLYHFALLNRYCVYNKDFALANNYAMYYNSAETELFQYLARTRPETTSELRKNPKIWR